MAGTAAGTATGPPGGPPGGGPPGGPKNKTSKENIVLFESKSTCLHINMSRSINCKSL